jgi:hypothetical protein
MYIPHFVNFRENKKSVEDEKGVDNQQVTSINSTNSSPPHYP